MADPLQLTDKVAEGNGSLVYAHPTIPGRLVKVMKDDHAAERRGLLTRPQKRKFGAFREWAVEYDHYLTLIARTGGCPAYQAGFYGFEETRFGVGQVVEKISDEGSDDLARTIGELVKGGGDKGVAQNLLDGFFQAIEKDRAIYRDIHLWNLCVVHRADGTPDRLVAVDGIGEFTVFPLRSYSNKAYRSWHARRWREVAAEIERL